MVWGAPKSGMNPSVSCSQGSRCSWTKGASTKRPQKPRITEGIAASISTSGETMPRTPPAPAGSGRGRSRSRSAPQQQGHQGSDGGAEQKRPGTEHFEVRCQVVWTRNPSPNFEIAGAELWTT